MAATVRLSDIVDALEMQFDESSSWLNLETGEVAEVSNDLLRNAEEYEEGEQPDLPAWQQDEWELARQIVSSNRFEQLPTKFDVHEWAIMEQFSHSVESPAIRGALLRAIRGRGAFRMFTDVLARHRMREAWFAYRTDALQRIAKDWCEEHHIVWT